MGEIVYLLGAGVNQVVKDWDGLSPPLLNSFFNVALSKRRFSNERYDGRMQIVYDYIKKYLKKTKDNLAKSSFDLEFCFTLLEQQIKQAQQEGEGTELGELVTIRFLLVSFLAEVLSEFRHFVFSSPVMRNLGRVLFYQKPTIITFNYDCLMEYVLELASGANPSIPESFKGRSFFEERELPDELLVYSHSKWNRALGYGFKFDEIQLQQAGVSRFVRGPRFYSLPQNQLSSKPLLKLHGSLNWFRYLPVRSFPALPGEPEPKLDDEKKSQIILKNDNWWGGRTPDHNGWFISPILITPTLYKEQYYKRKPFRGIWKLAKKGLSRCDKLVVIGYSFSLSDFATKQLFIESLMENDLKEIVVVDPNNSLAHVVKELCHFKGGVVWFSSLSEYLQTFSKSVVIENDLG